MITYDKSTGVYRSNNSSYDVMEIEPSLMFQWVKTKQITAGGFKFWLQLQLETAEQKGYIKGQRDADEAYCG